MSILFDAPVEPDALTTFVRGIPDDKENALNALFPTKLQDSNTVDFAEIVQTNRTAKYRSFDGRIHVSERDAGSDGRVRLAPLSTSLNMGEYERLQLEFAKYGGTNTQILANSVYNDGENLTREVLNRLELAWGDVLVDGKLSINENGLVSEADYGVAGLGNLVAPSGALWSNVTTSTPLSDMVAFVDQYKANGGGTPGWQFTSQRIIRYLQRNAEIINAIAGAQTGRTRVTIDELNGLLVSEGLPALLPAYDRQLSVDGTTQRVMPDDRWCLLPANLAELGYTAMGITATALELVNSNRSDLSFQDAPGIVGVVIKGGPPFRQFTYVDAVGMPVIVNARKLLTADVA